MIWEGLGILIHFTGSRDVLQSKITLMPKIKIVYLHFLQLVAITYYNIE